MKVECDAMQDIAPAAPVRLRKRQRLHRQDTCAFIGALAVVLAQQLAADHSGNDLVLIQFADWRGDYLPSIAQNGNAIGKVHHLIEAMRDVDDGNAARGQLTDDLEQPLALRQRQRRSRLVHDQDAG